jgi:serine/threonine protein kinase
MIADPATGYWPAPAGAESADSPTVPGFEILQELGRGGMGVVYKARQLSSNRLVALKLIRDGALASPDDQARFRIEAEAAARMRHPNVVAIYEIGQHAGRPYFAMELVEGGSLDKYLGEQPQPARVAAELVCKVALAVQHAHEQKIVHRDLKPANILLSAQNPEVGNQERDDSSLHLPHPVVPKITDFGLAKRLDSQSTALTREGAVLGTAGYMAPEQAEGRGRDIGPATDVYALGAILYELLTGQPPFESDSWNQMVQLVLQEEPVPPTRLQPNLPRDLETVCLKCLEKEAGQRYASAGELAEDLHRFLAGQPVSAVPLGKRERLDRLAKRHGYHIVSAIGTGPRSTVYHALEGTLKQAVAVKVYRAGICTQDEWEAWLRRAADVWAGLAHPQIVPIRRAGWWDGEPCLMQEYVPNGSLAEKLADRRFTVSQSLRLVVQLTEIVSYLHRQGVVHGNLKPTNVLLAADGIPRVTDIYPARGVLQRPPCLDDCEPSDLAYFAPELVRSPDAEPRPYTDIYGLGTILYTLLTGKPPFRAATAKDVLEQIRSQDPVPPSKVNTKLAPQLDGCCLRCLRRDPWRRYHRAYDLLMRLRKLQENLEGKA